MAVWMMLNVTALAVAPLGVLENRKFFLSITKGLMLRSAMLLLISRRPSFRYSDRPMRIVAAGISFLLGVVGISKNSVC